MTNVECQIVKNSRGDAETRREKGERRGLVGGGSRRPTEISVQNLVSFHSQPVQTYFRIVNNYIPSPLSAAPRLRVNLSRMRGA